MADKIPVRYLPTEEAQPALGEFRTGETVPVVHGGTGATTPQDARTNLGIVEAPGSVTQFPYTVSMPPNPTPLAGEVSFNNADPTLVTALYIHEEDGDAVDQTQFLQAIKARDWVNFFLVADQGTYQRYDATGPAVQNGSVYTVPVSYFDHAAGPLADGDAVNAYWRIASDPAVWGEIEGTLSDQADLQAALDAKVGSSGGDVADMIYLTQAEYDALSPPDPATFYLIPETEPCSP